MNEKTSLRLPNSCSGNLKSKIQNLKWAGLFAIHPPRGFSGISEKVEDRARDQIEYTDEEIWIRAKFEEELAKKRLKSEMPEEAYQNRNYEWAYLQ